MTKDSNIKLRVCKLAHYFSNSVREFERNVGLTRGSLGNLKPNQSISSEILSQITDKFPEINLYWLISGEGEMIKQPDLSAKSKSYTEKQDNKSCGICIEKDNRIADLLERTKAQAQIIDKFMSTLPVSCTDTISNK